MGVIEHWNRIVAWLADYAPVTRAALRPQWDALPELEVPEELRQWWSVYGGTDDLAFAEILPPFYTPLGPHSALRLRERNRAFFTADPPSEAGAPTAGFHPDWLPIASDGLGDALVVDLRPGVLRGCVVEWDRERRDMVKPEWTSIVEMFDQVATSLENRSRLGHCEPMVTVDGRLGWRTD